MSDLRIETTGKIVTVTLDRPPVNALTLALYAEIGDAFEALSRRTDVHCVVFTGAGTRAFCAGLDLHEFAAARPEQDPERAVIVRRTFRAVRHCALPVIGAINGPALGAGCVLASVTDVRIASTTATFGLPEINVGRCGGTAHMGRHLPQGLLRRMFFTGRPIDAAEAYRVGFVQEVVEPAKVMDSALALAAAIADKAPLGLRMGKKALNEVEYLGVEDGYEREQRYSTELMHSEDAREAVRAAVEKRAPVFHGR